MDTMRDGIAGLMKKYKVEVIEGDARCFAGLKISVNGETHEADNVLLCTGSSPANLRFPELIPSMWSTPPES